MDVSFTNVLEGARQYFQGLPAATSSTVGPAYSNPTENIHRNNNIQQNSNYWTSPTPQQQHQQEVPRTPTREQTPIQRPPSHHSDSSSRPPSHSQIVPNVNHEQNATQHYPGSYPEQAQSFQFPRPHSREAPSNVSQYQQHVLQNPTYHQPPSPQQPRTPTRSQEQVIWPNTSQYQNSTQSTQAYHNYQQQQPQQQQHHQVQQQPQQISHHQQQQRSYYQFQSPVKQQVQSGNDSYNKIVSSQANTQQIHPDNAYYKNMYSQSSSQMQMQYSNSKPTYTHPSLENQGGLQQSQNTPQAYRTTHNLPPIAALSSVNYHSNRSNRDVSRTETFRPKQQPNNATSTNQQNEVGKTGNNTSNATNIVQHNSMSMPSASYPTENYRNYITTHPNRQVVNQNYQYVNTTTTSNYSHVMTTSATTSSYTFPMQTQSSSSSTSSNQHLYQPNNKGNELQQRNQSNLVPNQHANQSVDHNNVNGRLAPVAKQKRESPLDLSVKTVRTSADSTDDSEHDSRIKHCPNNSTSTNSSVSTHSYPTYEVYADSFQRNLTSRPSATAPKVEFHPNFVKVCSQNRQSRPYSNNYRQIDKPQNIQRMNYEKSNVHPNNQQVNNTANRYPTVSVPTTAHVNSYIQSTPQVPKKLAENLPRIEFPSPGHGHKTAALYPIPTRDMQKKRPADTAPTIIPNKISKVNDSWRQTIDQQIEQRFSTYKQQQMISNYSEANGQYLDFSNEKSKTPLSAIKRKYRHPELDQHQQPQEQSQEQSHQQQVKNSYTEADRVIVNGQYLAFPHEKPKMPLSAFKRKFRQMETDQHQQQHPQQHQLQAYPPTSQQYSHSSTNHSQTYVPSGIPHNYPGYATYASQHQQNVAYPYSQPHHLSRTNSNPTLSVSSANKSNLGGADKRVLSLLRSSLEIKGAKEAQRKLEKEKMNRSHENLHQHVQHPSTDVTAPLQPKPGFIGRHNVSPFTPMNFPEGNTNMSNLYKLHIPKAIDSVNFEPEINKQMEDSQVLINNHVNSGADLDGLAAFLAARIRTKAELKQVGPTQQANNNANLQGKADFKSQVKQEMVVHGSVNGPNVVNPPKLTKEQQKQAFAPRRRLFSRSEEESGNNSSSNVPHRDKSGMRSSSETSVFDFPDSDSECEMPVLERQTLEDMRRDRKSITKQTPTGNNADIKMESEPEDDIFMKTCDNFMEQLKKSGSGKKRGRRKKVVEPDVLAKLETVTKEKPLEIKTELEVMEVDVKKPEEAIAGVEAIAPVLKTEADDDDSDVPLINCKTKATEDTQNPNEITKSIKMEDCKKIVSSDSSDNEVEIINESQNNNSPIKKDISDNNKVVKEAPVIVARPAKKPNFGDGSDFYPGWEEEVYKYKKSLRMPPSLIQVTRPPHYHRLSTSLPDLDPSPNSPFPYLVASRIKCEPLDSDTESSCSFNLFSNKKGYDSEGSSSISSLPNATKEPNSILDKLLEKYGAKNKRKYRRKIDNSSLPKITPKAENEKELLPTPGIGTEEDIQKKIDKSNDRKQSRVLKHKATIKEVFGEDRPASAPPVTCVNSIKIKEEIDDNTPLACIKKEDDISQSELDTKQVLKNRLLNKGTKRNNLLKSLVDKKIKSELLDEQINDDQEAEVRLIDGVVINRDPDSKSETPSIDGDEGSIVGKKRNKFRYIRRKLSSGFDYLRKKKKQVKKDVESDIAVSKPKRRPLSKSNPESVQDIQKEIKTWVLNKGIGETHLHRSARLGYTDIAAYCLEKMECIPSPKDNAGYTPLHEASARGHLHIAKLLLQYGANVSESARGGVRPLHEAVENGYVEIVRLLLSYGADPMLATYNGSTPLVLANDEATKTLLQNHINDSQGASERSSWIFPGPASVFDCDETGYNILGDVPDSDPISEEEDIEFEISDHLLPNLYTLRGEPQSDRWILLQDLSNLLKIKSRDALLRQICSTPISSASSVTSYKSVLRELKMSDFLEQAHCCQFLNIGEKVNTRASKIALVKYTEKVKELLSIERIVITTR